jgi:hypothetical protein
VGSVDFYKQKQANFGPVSNPLERKSCPCKEIGWLGYGMIASATDGVEQRKKIANKSVVRNAFTFDPAAIHVLCHLPSFQ